MITNILRIFAIICVAIVTGKLISKIKLPSILGWLVTGIVFGPYLVEVVTFDMIDSLCYKVFIKAIPHNYDSTDAPSDFSGFKIKNTSNSGSYCVIFCDKCRKICKQLCCQGVSR